MTTKKIPLALGVLLVGCAVLVYFIGTLRPFAATEKFSNVAPTAQSIALAAPTATPSRTPSRLPTHGALASRTPPEDHFGITRVAQTATLEPQVAAKTETSIPAQKTFDAISTRAFQTPVPKKSPTLRAIDKTTNFLFIGTDTRTSDPNWKPNSDVMIILFLDSTNQRAALLSLPRDLVVAIPGQQAFRINSAYHHGWEKGGAEGGVKILKQVLRDDFDIRIDHWALIDFDGLSKIIDTLGGITVNVACPLSDTIDDQAFTIPAGDVQMDYLTAKRYVQSRYTTSDTARNYRQQRVLWAIAKKALDLNAPDRVPTLYDELKANIATDMTLFDLVGLVPAAYQLDLQNHPERLRARVLEAPAVYPWISSSGAWLYMPHYEEIAKELDQIFDAPQAAGTQATKSECPPQAATPPPTEAPTLTPSP